MPYYNDVPYYYGGGAYANHSSLMTGIVRMPFHTSLSRFSPHLSTISESPLSHLHRFSPISVRSARRVIDTADIDVSSPRILSHNRNLSRNLRRDRPTIKIRSQALKDNPALREHNEKHEKSVGELLMEKFFIKDKKLVDNDNSQQEIRLGHQINLDRLEDSEERKAVRKRITRRFTRRRSSDLQLNSEQMQREAAYAQVQAKVLDSLVAEEQAQIENETRQGTSMFKKGTTAKGLLEHPYANNINSDMMIQEEEQAAMTRIRKAIKKTKKKRFIDKLSSTDKIDKRRSSTSSEISIDSQITENDESRPQIYKIEACNSAGDFSTFWMNTNAENKRCKSTDEKFKESIRVSIPNGFGTGNETDIISNADEAETQVVLTVQKSYIKDMSRNSVRLTIKKPTEKLNKKLKEIEKEIDVKADENQLNLTNSFVDIENNILTNNISKSLTDVDSAEPNCKIQMTNNIKDFKALKKTVYKSKNMESMARNATNIPILKDNSSNNRDTNILTTNSNMREIVTEDSSFSTETETTPIQSNILAFISTNTSRNDSQMENFRGILEDTFIADIKNDESQKDYLIDNITKKIFDLEADSTIKITKVLARKNSVASVESDKFISEKLTPNNLAMSHNENMIKQNIIEIESSDNVGKNNVSGTMLTTNSATYRLPKLSKINTDRNNAVEAPKLPLRETAEYQANSLKSDHDVETAAVVLPEKKMNKTSNLAQVSSFNASKKTNSAYKLSSKIDATRHNNAVKLEANETTLSKETNNKVYSSEYCDEAKLAADIKPAENVNLTKTSRNNAKRTDENILTLKTIDSSNIKTKMIITEAAAHAKEAELKTDSIKKINCIDVGKDSLKDLSNFKSKTLMLLKNNTNENDIANLSNIGKDSDAFNMIKIEDGKSFLCNANDETKILKKNISVDSSKLMNDHSTNNISKVFQQSISNDEKATSKDISIKKMSKITPVSKITEKKSMKIDPSYNSQDVSIILSRSTSTESIDFWSEIKAPNSPEMTRSEQQNGFPLRETSTSEIEKNINSMNSKRKDNERKTEIDVKMNTTTFESSIDGFSNIVFEKEKEKEKNVSKSLRSEKAEKEKKLVKATEIERNMPTMQKIPSKKKNFSIVIDTKNINPTVKKTSLKCNNFGTTFVTTSVSNEVTMPEINIVEAPELFKECDNRKIEEEHKNPSTPTNELSFNPSLIKKISRWSNQDDLTNIDDVETPVVSEETSLVTSSSVSPLQSSKTKHAIKKKKSSTKKALLEKSEKGLKEIYNNELITSVNERNMLITKFVPEKQHLMKILPKTSPKSSPKNTPLQRPLDLMKMFYTTPSALLTATPRDLSKVRRAKIKRRRHHSRTPSISSDSTESTTSTVTTRSTDENGSARVELNDDSERKRMNSTRSNDSGFDGSPRILRRI